MDNTSPSRRVKGTVPYTTELTHERMVAVSGGRADPDKQRAPKIGPDGDEGWLPHFLPSPEDLGGVDPSQVELL
jgi:hypothetical protein